MELLLILLAKSAAPMVLFVGGIVGLLVVIIVITVVLAGKQKKNQQKWAGSVGLKYNAKGLSGVDDMSGVFNGFQVEVGQETSFSGGGVGALTTFTLWFPQPILPPFELLKNDAGARYSERDLPPVSCGQTSLGNTYGVFTNHAEKICGVVADQRVAGILKSAASRYPRVWISEEMMVYYTPPRGTSTAAYSGHLKALTAAGAVLFEIATGQPAPRSRAPGGRGPRRRGGGPSGRVVQAPPAVGPTVQAPPPPSGKVVAPPPAMVPAPPQRRVAAAGIRRPGAIPQPRKRR